MFRALAACALVAACGAHPSSPALTSFPFAIGDDVETARSLDEAAFRAAWPELLAQAPAGPSRHPTMRQLVVNTTVGAEHGASQAAEQRIGRFVFRAAPAGWRFVRASTAN